MNINWARIMETERAQFEGMSEREKFAYFLALQYGSPYGWGKENPEAADCSGGVQLALYAATGLLVRTTADGLLKKIFTVRNPGREAIQAAFFVTQRDRNQDGGLVKKGTATHVAGIVGSGVALNAEEPRATFRSLEDLWNLHRQWDYTMELRGLDREALQQAAREGTSLYGPDPELAAYFGEETA